MVVLAMLLVLFMCPRACVRACVRARRWFAESSKVSLDGGRACTVRYPKRPGMLNLGAMGTSDGRAVAVHLDTMLRLAAGDRDGALGALPPARGNGGGAAVVVCKFTVVETEKFATLQTAFDSMTR